MSIREKIIAAERHVARRDFSAAARICLDFLGNLEGQTKHTGDHPEFSDANGDMTLLAGTITRLLTNPLYKPTNKEVHQFLLYKRVVSQVFEISGYRTTSHFMEMIGDYNSEQKWNLSPADICRLLMGLSINAASEKVVDLLRACDPTLAFLATIAFLSEQFVWSEQAEVVRSRLVKGDFLQDNVQLEGMEFKLLASAWMGCSYADAPHKHVIKGPLNSVVRKWLLSKGVEDIPVDRTHVPMKDRPKVLIIAELYYKDHAVDRCIGQDFRSLRKHFHTTLMMAAGRCDPAVAGQFDKMDSTEFNLNNPEKFLHQVRTHHPDIVYFPSVGMRIGGIACANVRLAPIQIAGMGHPATTHSPFLDYMALPEEILGDPACFNETLILRSGRRRFVMRSDALPIKPDIRRNPDLVRLAVPAWVRKPTPRFLAVCKEIVRKDSRPVEFWFFPNVRGALHQAMRRRLEGMLPARVFHSTSYNQYIANINNCDVHLSTFPFGASNGIVDSARQGLPVVNMDGIEPHSRVDGYLVQRMNQPDWLTASATLEYVDAVVRLVDDDELRVKISGAILETKPDTQFLLNDDDVTDDFAEIFLSIYQNHETMLSSGKKKWHYAELPNSSFSTGERIEKSISN